MKRTLFLFSVLVTLLSSCTAPTPPQAAQPQADLKAAEHVITIRNPNPALSDDQLATQYQGVLITRTDDFAVIATNTPRAAAGLSRQSLTDQSAVTREDNLNVLKVPEASFTRQALNYSVLSAINYWGNGRIDYWGNGRIDYWGNGTLAYWENGRIDYWGNGIFDAALPFINETTWKSIGLDKAHQRLNTQSGKTIKIAILDTGVDLAHPMFVGRLSNASDWRDFVDGDNTPQDEGTFGEGATGHGTEVAGLALIVAPTAQIMPLRVLDKNGSGHVANVVTGIVWAVNRGANIINLSLGSDQPVEAVAQAIRYANDKGVIVVAAAGNNGQEGPTYPAAAFASSKLNLSVGSLSDSGLKSPFSQYGSISLLAPGEQMVGPAPQKRLAAWTGTSMSAPITAGAAALALKMGSWNAEQVVSRIKTTATPVDHLVGNLLYRGKLGAGRLNLDALTQPQP